MQIPRIEIFLDEKAGELICRHIKQDAQTPLQIELSLSHLSDLGFSRASEGIGAGILKTISLWHPTIITKYEGLRAPYDAETDIETLEYVIEKSINTRTRRHLEFIERLIGNVLAQAPEIADESLQRRWHIAVQTIQGF